MKNVRIKKDWCSCPEEHDIVYEIVQDNGDRLIITPKIWEHGQIRPQELVRDYMIEYI